MYTVYIYISSNSCKSLLELNAGIPHAIKQFKVGNVIAVVINQFMSVNFDC